MSFKKNFKEGMSNKEVMNDFRYDSAKTVFVFVSFLFFLSFFSLSVDYYTQISLYIISPLYVVSIFSLDLFMIKFFSKKFGNKKNLAKIFSLVFVVFSLFLLIILF